MVHPSLDWGGKGPEEGKIPYFPQHSFFYKRGSVLHQRIRSHLGDREKKYIFSHSNDSLGVFHTPGQRRLHYYAAPCLDNIWKDFDVVKKRRCYNHNIHIGTRQKILQVPIAFIYMVAFGIAQGLGVAVIGNSFEGKIFVLCQGITMVIGR